jgi:hypothetical protein
MMRFSRKSEQAAGLASTKQTCGTSGYIASREALVGVLNSLIHGHGQITSFNQSVEQIFHIRFEDGTAVEFAARLRDAPTVREFLVGAMRAVN